MITTNISSYQRMVTSTSIINISNNIKNPHPLYLNKKDQKATVKYKIGINSKSTKTKMPSYVT